MSLEILNNELDLLVPAGGFRGEGKSVKMDVFAATPDATVALREETNIFRQPVTALTPAARPGAFRVGFTVVRRWIGRSRERRHILALNDYLLKDLGLSRADVYNEARKPFWRA